MDQIRASKREHGKTVLYLPTKEGRQPDTGDVWLVDEEKTVHENPTFKIVVVNLRELLFQGTLRLQFAKDKTLIVNGQYLQKALVKHDKGQQVQIIECIPDKFGKHQPSADKPFWVCQHVRDLKISPQNRFARILVELFYVDQEAEDRAIVELEKKRREHAQFLSDQKEEEIRRRNDLDRMIATIDLERHLGRRQKQGINGPGRGCLTRRGR